MKTNRILVTGRITLPDLDAALYTGWDVESFTYKNGGCVAVVVSESGDADYMAGRLSSFSNIGVRTEWTAEDMADSLALINN